MNLGDLIKRLELEDSARVLPLGFHNPHSYRGYYDQLAFEPASNVSVASLLAAARSALGKTFTGYKGGEYLMGSETPCWIAKYGESTNDEGRLTDLVVDALLARA